MRLRNGGGVFAKTGDALTGVDFLAPFLLLEDLALVVLVFVGDLRDLGELVGVIATGYKEESEKRWGKESGCGNCLNDCVIHNYSTYRRKEVASN